jgi:hypothetical protein
MDIRQKIVDVLNETIADIFMKDKDFIAVHHELNFRMDLNATSMQYYPLITEMEEQLDIELDAHDFQWKAHTIEDAVDFVMEAYLEQKGE